jgi:aerobic carbon-monoxide dehydrogenase medium subunit
MKPPPFDYIRPESLDELCAALTTAENAKILAGGQSLMAMLNLRYVFPDVLIDINRVPGLSGIEIADGRLRIGAMTRQRAIEVHPEVARHAPILVQALHLVGHRQTRNRGTIGGSLCHLDPAAELPTLALLYDAEVEVASLRGRRVLPMGDFVLDYMTPAIEADEVVSAVTFPLWGTSHRHHFHEFSRRHGDFAIASAGCLVERGADGTISRAAIAIGGVGSVPQRLPEAEARLVGTAGDSEAITHAVDACARLSALGDFHGSADYRISVAGSVLRRALNASLGRVVH